MVVLVTHALCQVLRALSSAGACLEKLNLKNCGCISPEAWSVVPEGCWTRLHEWKGQGADEHRDRLCGGSVEAPVATEHAEEARHEVDKVLSKTLREVIIDCRGLPQEDVKKHAVDGFHMAAGTSVLEIFWVRGTVPIQAWRELSTAVWPKLREVDLTSCFQDDGAGASEVLHAVASAGASLTKLSLLGCMKIPAEAFVAIPDCTWSNLEYWNTAGVFISHEEKARLTGGRKYHWRGDLLR
mmetsp:Transcript_58961/g.190873  ORF Transcript_58961/g.190873 Transcript_58961/m.190873 type:complete len:241 (-) Transcript_58961:68-790(-)